MAGSRRVTVEFLGDDKSASRTARSVGSATSKLGDTFKKVGKMAAVGLAVGIGVATAAAIDFVKAAAEDQASASKLALALKNSTGATKADVAAVENWISKRSLATGVADDELRPAFQRLAEATGDTTKAMGDLVLAQDIAAGTGKSLETVSMALMKAEKGNVSGLGRLGVATKNAKGETLSFHKIQKDLAKTFGGQASKHAETFQGKMERLNVMFNEAKEQIGYALLPIVMKLAERFQDDVIPAIQKGVDWFSRHLAPALRDVIGFIKGTVLPILVKVGKFLVDNFDVIGPIVVVLGTMVAAFSAVTAVVKAYTAVQAALNVVLTANPIGLVVVAIAGLVAGLIIAYKKSETFRDIVDGTFEKVRAVVEAVMPVVVKLVKGAFSFIEGAVRLFSNVFKGDWDAVWIQVKKILNGAWGVIKAVVRAGFQAIKDILGNLGGWLKNQFEDGFNKARDGAAAGWASVKSFVKSIPGRIKDALKGLYDKMVDVGEDAIQGIIQGMGNLKGALMSTATNLGWDLGTAFADALDIGSPSKVFRGYGVNIVEGLEQGIDSKSEDAKKAVERLAAKLAKAADALKAAVSAKMDFQSSFASGFSSSVFGGEKTTVGGILAQAKKQAAAAVRLRRDTAKLIKMGLSDALIRQMAEAGDAGIAQIHALATQGSEADIRQLNQAAAKQARQTRAASRAAGGELYDDKIARLRDRKENIEDMEKAMRNALDHSKGTHTIVVQLDGKDIRTSLLRHKRQNGNVALGIA